MLELNRYLTTLLGMDNEERMRIFGRVISITPKITLKLLSDRKGMLQSRTLNYRRINQPSHAFQSH
jgi:hypothetical protein